MEKINVVLVVLNEKFLQRALFSLDIDSVHFVAVLTKKTDKKTLNVGAAEVPILPFAAIPSLAKISGNFVWIICGWVNDPTDTSKAKKILMNCGVPEDNIANFEGTACVSVDRRGNLRDNEDELGLTFQGVHFIDANQDLLQSYLTAKHVFEHVAPGTFKFIFIGITPYLFRFDRPKNSYGELSADTLINRDIEQKNLTKKIFSECVEKTARLLKDYIKLCDDHGIKPVVVLAPLARIEHDICSAELLGLLRTTILRLKETLNFTCVDLFNVSCGLAGFCYMVNTNLPGAFLASFLLRLQLHVQKILPFENILDVKYGYLDMLSHLLTKEGYNSLISDILTMSLERLRRKKKIKVGFVTDDTAMWCGDKLYNYFARDERFEPTVFPCLRMDKADKELVRKDFPHGVEQFKSRGLNVFPITERDAQVPTQDIIFYLRPYMPHFPYAFRFENLKPETLLAYIPYSFQVAQDFYEYHSPIFYLPWKIFFSSQLNLNYLAGICKFGMPRGVFSGYPRLDTLFEDELKFDWKMTRPDAKKIIYAPHWSIKGTPGIEFSTFQWNYKFMYEFAKAHPEISWVVKPHPTLLFSAVESGVFPSAEAFEEYLQAWNDLPNAQVYTGAYYHAVFATSDGMIHDCGSFIGEYQYVNKPMIYMTRDTQKFNEIATKILSVSYTVDGRDLDGIAALMQKIFIDGEDPKRSVREKFFDEYLNYYKRNGMSASEFIYRNIRDELKG